MTAFFPSGDVGSLLVVVAASGFLESFDDGVVVSASVESIGDEVSLRGVAAESGSEALIGVLVSLRGEESASHGAAVWIADGESRGVAA